MILTRKEFHSRWSFRNFDVIHAEEKDFPIEPLIKEIKADASHRNHEYLFDRSDLTKKECNDEIGINKYCKKNVKTEAQRIAVIDQQIKTNTYTPVKIFQDIEHTEIFIVDDGFHRIYSAWKQNKKIIRITKILNWYNNLPYKYTKKTPTGLTIKYPPQLELQIQKNLNIAYELTIDILNILNLI